MTLEEVIEQLEDIKSHCEDMTVSGMSCDIWRRDAIALGIAIKIIKKTPRTAIQKGQRKK